MFLCDKLPMFKKVSYCGKCGLRTTRSDLMVSHGEECGRAYERGDFFPLSEETRADFATRYAAKFQRLRDGRDFVYAEAWRSTTPIQGVGRGRLSKVAAERQPTSTVGAADTREQRQHDNDNNSTTDSDEEFNFRRFLHRTPDYDDNVYDDTEQWGTIMENIEAWESDSTPSSTAETVVDVSETTAASPRLPNPDSAPVEYRLSSAMKIKSEPKTPPKQSTRVTTPPPDDADVPTAALLDLDLSYFDDRQPDTEPWTPPLSDVATKTRATSILAAALAAPLYGADEGMAKTISKIIGTPLPTDTVWKKDWYDWRSLPARPDHNIREHHRRAYEYSISTLQYTPAMLGELRSNSSFDRTTKQRLYFERALKTGIYDIRGGNAGLRFVVVPHWLNPASECDDPTEDVSDDKMTVLLTSMMTRPPMVTSIASIQSYLPMGEYEVVPRESTRDIFRVMVADEG